MNLTKLSCFLGAILFLGSGVNASAEDAASVQSSTTRESDFSESLKKIEASVEFQNKQVMRQQSSNQYLQLLSVVLDKSDPKHIFKEHTFRVTVKSTDEERDAFLKVISAKMFEIDCESHNFEHPLVGNRYIYILKDQTELFRFEDSEAICAALDE